MESNYKNEGFSVSEILPGVYLCEMDEMDMLRHTFMRMRPVQLRQVTTLRRTGPHTWFIVLLSHHKLLVSFWTKGSAFLFYIRLHKLGNPENNPS